MVEFPPRYPLRAGPWVLSLLLPFHQNGFLNPACPQRRRMHGIMGNAAFLPMATINGPLRDVATDYLGVVYHIFNSRLYHFVVVPVAHQCISNNFCEVQLPFGHGRM